MSINFTGEIDESRRIPVFVMVPATVFMTLLFCGGAGLLLAGVFNKSAHEFIYGASAITAGSLWLYRERRARLMKWAHATFALSESAWGALLVMAFRLQRHTELRYIGVMLVTAACWLIFRLRWQKNRRAMGTTATAS